MICLKIGFLLFTIFVSAQSIHFRGLTYDGMKVPKFYRSRLTSANERWIQQSVDHFNSRDNRTWSMRYYENGEYFFGTGPMLVMLGGEWAIDSSFLEYGQMYQIAKLHGGMMYYTEHRYYGKSHPVDDTTPENLQYLNVDQALADVAYFIETKKKEIPELSNSKVIVFGGSYSGNMAAWARLKYPHLIQGAVASSAPVHAKADFFEYYDVVATSLSRYNEQCIVDIKSAFESVEKLLALPEGPETIKTDFNLCEVPDVSSAIHLGFFMNGLAEEFAEAVQYNHVIVNVTSNIKKLCDKMMDTSVGTPISRLAKIISSDRGCVDLSYKKFIEKYSNTSWESAAGSEIMRLWQYQTCTEYGYYQTTNSSKSIFGTLFPIEIFQQVCKDLYGEYYNSNLLELSVRRTNLMYGGSLPDVKNVIFTNGNVDPWHALSVLEDLNENSPAILIDGSSHCEDLNEDTTSDITSLKEARKRVRAIVSSWITGE